MSDNLQTIRKRFCCFYAKLCNITEAARRAGFPHDSAYEAGLKTLTMPAYRRLVQRLGAQSPLSPQQLVQAGLERLAFGSANDAVYLICAEELPAPAQLAALDLYNVSELKRIKGGGLEVKFFDRQRALERIYEYANSADTAAAAGSLLAALSGAEHPVGKEEEDGV